MKKSFIDDWVKGLGGSPRVFGRVAPHVANLHDVQDAYMMPAAENVRLAGQHDLLVLQVQEEALDLLQELQAKAA